MHIIPFFANPLPDIDILMIFKQQLVLLHDLYLFSCDNNKGSPLQYSSLATFKFNGYVEAIAMLPVCNINTNALFVIFSLCSLIFTHTHTHTHTLSLFLFFLFLFVCCVFLFSSCAFSSLFFLCLQGTSYVVVAARNDNYLHFINTDTLKVSFLFFVFLCFLAFLVFMI